MDLDEGIHDAVQKLDDGLELVIVRGSRAKWRARRGITFPVQLERAKRLINELKAHYHVRTGVNPPRRILTPEPILSEDHPSRDGRNVVAREWETVRDLARSIDISTSGIHDAIGRDSINAVKRVGAAADGRRTQLLHVRVDEALASYLASLGHTGTLITHDGRDLTIQNYRPVVHLRQEQYTHKELAAKLECSIFSVREKLQDKDIPYQTEARGLHVYKACDALVDVIEEEWTVQVVLE